MARRSRWGSRTASAGLVTALGALALAISAPGVVAADQGVAMSGFAYSPDTVTVTVGDTVTWSNSDAVAHTATADDGSFDTGSIGGGSSDGVTFAAAGTFAYHCTIHPTMTGTVVVQAAAASPSPAASAGASSSPSASTAPTVPPTDTGSDAAPVDHGRGSTWLRSVLLIVAALFAAVALLSLRLRPVEVEDDDRRRAGSDDGGRT